MITVTESMFNDGGAAIRLCIGIAANRRGTVTHYGEGCGVQAPSASFSVLSDEEGILATPAGTEWVGWNVGIIRINT
jgi:hypothetical protein